MSPLHSILIAVTLPIVFIVLGCIVWDRISPTIFIEEVLARGVVLCLASGVALLLIGALL